MTTLLYFFTFIALVQSSLATAHRASDSFLTIQKSSMSLSGQLDISVRDLEWELGLDLDDNEAITWGEIRQATQSIFTLVASHLKFQSNGHDCNLTFLELAITRHSDGPYTALPFNVNCPHSNSSSLEIRYELFFKSDADHRGLYRFKLDELEYTGVFSPGQSTFRHKDPSRGEEKFADKSDAFFQFIHEGISHIFGGLDHMMFLVVLLLPVIANRAIRGTAMLLHIFKLVTAFTFGHSVSLCLSSYDLYIFTNSRVIESLIAVSVIVTALANILRTNQIQRQQWTIALGFGLVHGMAFALILKDLELSGVNHLLALLGFNLGVEFAQLGIAVVIVSLGLISTQTDRAGQFILKSGSSLAVVIATIWLIERAFDISLF